MDFSKSELLIALKATSNKHNALNQKFQNKVRRIMNEIIFTGSIRREEKIMNEVDGMCAEYSVAMNRIEIEYIMQSEIKLSSHSPQKSSRVPAYEYDSAEDSAVTHIKNEFRSNYNEDDDDVSCDADGYYHCTECGKQCVTKRELESCKLLHLLKPFKCDYCPATFAKEAWRNRHIRNLHATMQCIPVKKKKKKKKKGNKTPPNWGTKLKGKEYEKYVNQVGYPNNIAHQAIESKCMVCDETFPTKYKMRDHMFKAHPKARPYKCHLCSSSFNVDRYLSSHLRNSHHIDPYKCDQCDATFPFFLPLEAHKKTCKGQRVKEENRDNEEKELSRELSRRGSVNVMVKKEWKCHYDECDESFSTNDALNVHIRIDHNGYPFRCEYCHEKYQYKKELITHIAQSHKDILQSVIVIKESPTNGNNAKDETQAAEEKKDNDREDKNAIIVSPPQPLKRKILEFGTNAGAPPAKKQKSVSFNVANLILSKHEQIISKNIENNQKETQKRLHTIDSNVDSAKFEQMSVNVALSPAPKRGIVINPHESIIRQQRNVPSSLRSCRSNSCPFSDQRQRRRRPMTVIQPGRRQSLAAMTGNRSNMPPTPTKTNYVKRKTAHTGKRRSYLPLSAKKLLFLTSPKKKRKLANKRRNSVRQKSISPNIETKSKQLKFFHNLGLVGSGSFCQVFKVRNAANKKEFALKKASTFHRTREAVDEALREVRIMKLLQQKSNFLHFVRETEEKDEESMDMAECNEHIVRFYDHWLSYKCQLHQIYEYYRHGTLADLISNNYRFCYVQILEIMRQICAGLEYVHSMNVIHLDLKPTNIFVSDEHVLKIGDFGIAVDLNPITPKGTAIKPKYHCSGDPIYLAPEMLSFNKRLGIDINAKTDVFSAGIMMLELLCDIKAPSQGQIFRDLRDNKIDFGVLELSPVAATKSKKMEKGGFGFEQKSATPKKTDIQLVNELDVEIKDLCRQMLQKENNLRPNCTEIICKIDEIRTNKKYKTVFSVLSSFEDLRLPEEYFIETMDENKPKSEQRQNASHAVSLCGSTEKKTNEEDDEKKNIIHVATPRCYESLMNHLENQKPDFELTPHSSCSKNDCQLNLTSAFDNAIDETSPKIAIEFTPPTATTFCFKPINNDSAQSEGKSNDKIAALNILSATDDEEEESDDDDLFVPSKLTFDFL